MIEQIKAKLIDQILSGRDIYCDTVDHTEQHIALFTKPYAELFRWKGGGVPFTAYPLTLRDALAIVDHHWDNRVRRGEA